ncbi:hypothetical protein AArcSl_1746 [Halalkaliarchaeum desulfuricum]|uniref:Uncharacterized protein n=1 Tax=Halalkaliarchaeum desulfuricum TaxID=2055893 RepID=A0A343TJV2_9EURY|nr:hypothetical protein [Halalkaliarchaeum desulfuricum]AUX09374.1 hypothetical protein AArcSl_1746 [Halalkaliarchaeum desulfuricum]
MNDTDEGTELDHQVLRTARVEGLRRRMTEFIESNGHDQDLKELRAGVDSMGDRVDDGRTERI